MEPRQPSLPRELVATSTAAIEGGKDVSRAKSRNILYRHGWKNDVWTPVLIARAKGTQARKS
jgi:hypothetical protein